MHFFRKIRSHIDDTSLNRQLVQHHRWVMTQGQDGIQADYVEKNLSQRVLIIVDFRQAKLAKVNFSKTTLFRTDFTDADLSDANLQGSVLFCANLTGARLEGADFTNAAFGQTILSNVDLSRCKGLESVQHSMPSPIGIDTLP
jgi:uncharacterized protein YjbI with pentapeptide repeats